MNPDALVIDAGESDEIHILGFYPNDPFNTLVLDLIWARRAKLQGVTA